MPLSAGEICTRRCSQCRFHAGSIFSALEGPALDRLDAGKEPAVFPPATPLFRQGEPFLAVFCIGSGNLKVSQRRETLKEAVVRLAAPGDLAGHRSLFSGGHYRGSAVALETLSACFIPAQLITELLHSQPRFAAALVGKLVRDVENAERRLFAFSVLPVRERVAENLLMLLDSHGAREDGAYRLKLELTRAELASLMGAAEETVIRVLSEFSARGWIRKDERQLLILQPESLRRAVAGGGREPG